MIRLIRFQPGVAIVSEAREANSNFTIWWEQVCDQIEESINEIIAAQEAAAQAAADAAVAQAAADQAQNDAIAAQGDAITAIADAAAAQSTANDALGTATTAVQQNVGPTWADATGTASRTAFAAVTGVGPFTVSNPPTQAEVQAIGNALTTVSANQVTISQHMVAMINDLYGNKALTN